MTDEKKQGMETTPPPRQLTALDMQSLTTDALEMMHIIRIALLEAFNPIQGQDVDAMTVIHGAYKILTRCEKEIETVEEWLGDA